MRNVASALLLGIACVGLTACGDAESNTVENSALAADQFDDVTMNTGSSIEAEPGVAADGSSTAAANWPSGTRIVEERGVTYRIDPDGTRVALSENESRIIVENGVRYRLDPGGARVRIDERGLVVDVERPDVDVDLPDVDVEVNRQ